MSSKYTFKGVDNVTWGFNPADGDKLRLKYARGINGAPFKLDTTHGVDQAGVTTHGRDVAENIIELGVFVEPGVKGAAAVTVGRQWLDSLGNGMNLGRFTVTDTGRFQEVRYPRIDQQPLDFDKLYNTGFCLHEVKLVSDESWWRANPRDYLFEVGDFATAKIRNDGDEPSWWWAKLTGPITNPTLGVDGEAIELPDIEAGDFLTIQTDPDWYAVVDSTGTDRAWIGERWRKRAPAKNTNIDVTVTGTGTSGATQLEMVVPQLFERAL